MTSLADYYRALPALSRSLYRALTQYNTFEAFSCEPEVLSKMLNAAIKLRHRDLFRECIILVAGKWDTEPVLSRHDQKISKLITATRNGIGYEIARAESKIKRLVAQYGHLQIEINKVKLQEYSSLPEYFRRLKEGRGEYGYCDYRNERDEFEGALDTLLGNNLKFGGSKYLSGEEPLEDYFLCATIDDDDLPWDHTQADW
jgi:hypothetical protein